MPTIDNADVSLGASIWGFANNQPGTAPPPGTDVNRNVFLENPFWGPPFGPGPYNGWGLSGTTNGDDIVYGFTAKTTNIRFSEWKRKTFNYDNNTSGGFAQQFKFTNNLGPSGQPPFFYNNTITVAAQTWDSTTTNPIGSGNATVGPGSNSGFITITNTNSPILKYVYWRIIIANNNTDTNALVDININGSSYVSGYSLPQYNSNLVIDWQTYGSALTDNTGLGYTGATIEVIIQ